MSLVGTITDITSWLTLLAHFLVGLFLISLLRKTWRNNTFAFIRRYALWASFLISFFGILLSLYYSEIVGYVPCIFCWFQRIFLYPQALLFAVALWRKDKTVFYYALPLTVIGGLIGIYHVFLTLVPAAETCAATGVSCAANYFVSFGYISIPVMSLTAFVLLFVFALIGRQKV